MKGKGKYLIAVVGIALLALAVQVWRGQQPETIAVAQSSGPCEDIYEAPVSDDNPNGAKVLEEVQEHNFHSKEDVDIVAINIGEPGTVAVLTFDLDENVDTVLTLVKDTGEEVVGPDWVPIKNDNDLQCQGCRSSRLVVEVDQPQTLFVKVTNKYGLGGCGEGFGYKIYYKFYATEPEPTVTPTPTLTPFPVFELTVTPTPEPTATPEVPTPEPSPVPIQPGCWSNYLGRMCQPGEEKAGWQFKCICDGTGCRWVPNR